MGKVITITNQKGGTGKTTTAAALTAGLSLRGYKVLCVDMDSQGNLSHSMGADRNGATVLGLLTGELTAKEAIQHTRQADTIASKNTLAGADAFIIGVKKEYRLKEALEPVKEEYDFILIDTPPALGILTVNALTASDSVVVPIEADIYSLQGVDQLAETIQAVREYCNKDLQIDGLLLTRFNQRSILNREIVDLAAQLAGRLGTKLFDAKIREGIAVKEARILQQNIFEYAPNSNPAADYSDLIDELMQE